MATELELIQAQAFDELEKGEGTGLLVLADYLDEQGGNGELFRELGTELKEGYSKAVNGSSFKKANIEIRTIQNCLLEACRWLEQVEHTKQTISHLVINLSTSAADIIARTPEIFDYVAYVPYQVRGSEEDILVTLYGLPLRLYGLKVRIDTSLLQGVAIISRVAPYLSRKILIHSIK